MKKIFPTALIVFFALTIIYLISTMYQKPLSSWFAKEGDHYHKHFILAGDKFTCETNDSFIEIKYMDDSSKDIILNEWKDYKKEGSPLFTVNSKTGVLQQPRGGTGVCWAHGFVYLKDGKEMSLFEKGKCGPGISDYEQYEINAIGGVGLIEDDSDNKDCFDYTYLQKPLESNEENISFNFKYDETNSIENFNFWGWFKPLSSGGLGYLSGSVKMNFKRKDDYDYKFATIEVEKNFALPPLQGKCIELYDDDFKGECKIQNPVWLEPPNNDLSTHAPVRVLDIDFDGEDEIIIGTIDGNRFWHEYKIYELEETEKTIKAVPTISFRGDAIIDKDKKTLTSFLSSSSCGLITTTYKSDGEGFKMVKRIESDQFNWPDDMSCIERTYEGLSEKSLVLVNEKKI